MKDRGIGITDELSPRPMNHGAHRPSQRRPTASFLPRSIDVCTYYRPSYSIRLLIPFHPFFVESFDSNESTVVGFLAEIARLVGAHLSTQRKADSYLPRDFLKFDGDRTIGSFGWDLARSGMRNGWSMGCLADVIASECNDKLIKVSRVRSSIPVW